VLPPPLLLEEEFIVDRRQETAILEHHTDDAENRDRIKERILEENVDEDGVVLSR
jgi:hypothetical protein